MLNIQISSISEGRKNLIYSKQIEENLLEFLKVSYLIKFFYKEE